MIPSWKELPGNIKGSRLENIIAKKVEKTASRNGIDISDVPNEDGVDVFGILLAREIISRLSLLQEPMGLEEFDQRRSDYLRVAFMSRRERNRRVEKSIDTRWWHMADRNDYFRLLLLDAGGLLMKNELNALEEMEGEMSGEPSKKILNVARRELFRTRISDRLPIDKRINTVEEGAEMMAKSRVEGNRVVLTMGAFDGPHAGHTKLFNKISEVIGIHGRLFVFLASDEELKIFKDREPIFTQETRMSGVASSAAVDYVCPIKLPEEIRTQEELERFYTGLHSWLLPHFRVIGDKDDRFEAFEFQCKNANIGLLITGTSGVASTTELFSHLRR